MKLTDTRIKRLKAKDKRYRVNDGDSLYLAVEVSGKKTWEVFLRNAEGKKTPKVIGKYPAMGLKEARLKRDRIKHGGADTKYTFGDLATDFLELKKEEWSEQYIKDQQGYFKNHLYNLWDIPLVDITNADIVAVA